MSVWYLIGMVGMLILGTRLGTAWGRTQAPEYYRQKFVKKLQDAMTRLDEVEEQNKTQRKVVTYALLGLSSEDPSVRQQLMELIQGFRLPSGLADEARQEFEDWRKGKVLMGLDDAMQQVVGFVEAAPDEFLPNATTRLAARTLADFVSHRKSDDDAVDPQ